MWTLVMLTLTIPAFAASATADKGTAIIDGVTEDVWSNTHGYAVDKHKDGVDTGVKGEFKCCGTRIISIFFLL